MSRSRDLKTFTLPYPPGDAVEGRIYRIAGGQALLILALLATASINSALVIAVYHLTATSRADSNSEKFKG